MNYCQCNCGKEVKNKWSIGHNRKGTTFMLPESAKEKMRLAKLGPKNPQFGKQGTCLGRKQTPEQVEKIKAARANQIITYEHKRKISLGLEKAWHNGTRIKENLSWWKGGITPVNKMARKTVEYKLWRKAVFERDNYTCQHCDVRGGELAADHIKPFALYPELRTLIENGRTLCKACHLKTPTFAFRYDLLIKQGTQT